MNANYQSIESLVQSVRKRRRKVHLLRMALITISVVLGLLLLSFLILPGLQGGLRLGLRIAFLLALFAAVISGTVLALLGGESLDQAALKIELVNPWLNNALINSVQLVRSAKAGGPGGAFSPVFLDKHLEKTAAMLDRIELDKAVPFSVLKPWALVASVLSILFLGVLSLFPEHTSRGFAAVFQEPWRLEKAEQQIAALVLTTGDFTIHYAFPEYSGLEPQTVAHTNGDIAGLKGTSVVIETRVLEPLKSAALVTSSGTRYAMEIDDGGRLKAELVLSEPGTYYIEGKGVDDTKRAEPRSHRIVVDEDLAPEVMMLTPVEDVEVAAEGSLHLSFQASDDFGIRELNIIYQKQGEQKRVLIKKVREHGIKRLRDGYEWRISTMDFRPGERIPFHLQVVDNDEVSGGNIGRSEMRVLEIFSARKHHRQLLARQDELMNLMIDHLAAHIEAWLQERESKSEFIKTEKKLLDKGGELVTFISSSASSRPSSPFLIS